MGIDDDQRPVNDDFLTRRLTLVRGEARAAPPHQAPKLELIVNADRKLLEAVMANDPGSVSTWLARGANANARDADGRTPLFEAVLPWKDPAITELLLGRGANVRVRDKDGQTPLHAAAAFGGEAPLCFVLDRGAEIDARDAAGRTPLHCAARLGRVEAVTQLVSRGADVGIPDNQGRTPLDRVLANRLLDPQDNRREPLARLLGGFMTAKVVEARPDSLILRVESLHTKYPEAERRATERGTLTVPCGVFRKTPEPGQLVRCEKGLTPGLDEAWSEARRKAELGIERER
jgi:ankyrin repeat protein